MQTPFKRSRWKKLGRSRKKIVTSRCPPMSVPSEDYYTRVTDIETQLQASGIDLIVQPSMSVKMLYWCTGISLCVPIEVRCQDDVRALAAMAKGVLKRETTLAAEFPGYEYKREDWLAEAELRA